MYVDVGGLLMQVLLCCCTKVMSGDVRAMLLIKRFLIACFIYIVDLYIRFT